MESSSLLSSLCSICHQNTPKYKCPRCSTRTCSLSCSALHKSRAACSGTRDPAAYVTKVTLQTPAAFDRDYNFLAGVERRLERQLLQLPAASSSSSSARETHDAHETHEQRARVQTALAKKRKLQLHAWKKAVAAEGVRMILGPAGLSRALANRCKLGKGQQEILWTVEWLFHDDTRCLTNGVNHSQTLLQAYETAKMVRNSQKVVLEEPGAEVQPMETFSPENQTQSTLQDDKIIQSDSSACVQDSQNPATKQDFTPIPSTATPTLNANHCSELPSSSPSSPSSSSSASATSSSTTSPDSPTSSSAHSGRETSPSTPPPAFYLVRPRTTGPAKVLCPVMPSHTFAQILKGRTVLEFPTIQVFSDGGGAAGPAGLEGSAYILERDYHEQQKGWRQLVGSRGEGEAELDSGADYGGHDDESDAELRSARPESHQYYKRKNSYRNTYSNSNTNGSRIDGKKHFGHYNKRGSRGKRKEGDNSEGRRSWQKRRVQS